MRSDIPRFHLFIRRRDDTSRSSIVNLRLYMLVKELSEHTVSNSTIFNWSKLLNKPGIREHRLVLYIVVHAAYNVYVVWEYIFTVTLGRRAATCFRFRPRNAQRGAILVDGAVHRTDNGGNGAEACALFRRERRSFELVDGPRETGSKNSGLRFRRVPLNCTEFSTKIGRSWFELLFFSRLELSLNYRAKFWACLRKFLILVSECWDFLWPGGVRIVLEIGQFSNMSPLSGGYVASWKKSGAESIDLWRSAGLSYLSSILEKVGCRDGI